MFLTALPAETTHFWPQLGQITLHTHAHGHMALVTAVCRLVIEGVTRNYLNTRRGGSGRECMRQEEEKDQASNLNFCVSVIFFFLH